MITIITAVMVTINTAVVVTVFTTGGYYMYRCCGYYIYHWWLLYVPLWCWSYCYFHYDCIPRYQLQTACAIGHAVNLHFLSLKGQVQFQHNAFGFCEVALCHVLSEIFLFSFAINSAAIECWYTRRIWRQSLQGVWLTVIQKLKSFIYCKIEIWKVNFTARLLHAGCRHTILTLSVLRKKVTFCEAFGSDAV